MNDCMIHTLCQTISLFGWYLLTSVLFPTLIVLKGVSPRHQSFSISYTNSGKTDRKSLIRTVMKTPTSITPHSNPSPFEILTNL